MRKTKPDIRNYNPDPQHLRDLLAGSPFTYEHVAREMGISERTLYNWLAGDRGYPYHAQFTLERLCA